MNNYVINEDAIDRLISEQPNLVWTEKKENEFEKQRISFCKTYDISTIKHLSKEEYFPGLGQKEGCIAYDLEWTTKNLGSIKGGSKYKFGYESDFTKIKSLLQKLMQINEKDIYDSDGNISPELQKITALSKEINGFKTGRTVIPKLLSLYYPQQFLPIFNDQDHFIESLFIEATNPEHTGLKLYLQYNFKLLKFKQAFESASGEEFNNYKFAKLLYHTYPKENGGNGQKNSEGLKNEEEFEALEVQHYQSLLHRNFKLLFPKLNYFDVEEQIPHSGHYDTQTVGIMDMLCVDDQGNFTVIEIKRRATDTTVGQILRYMGWTREELCKDGQQVNGLIIGERKDVQLEFAMKMVPSVEFKRLSLEITLDDE